MNDEYRTDATRTGSEREQIEWFLHDNRVEVVGLLQQLVAAGRTPGLGAGPAGPWVGPAVFRRLCEEVAVAGRGAGSDHSSCDGGDHGGARVMTYIPAGTVVHVPTWRANRAESQGH